MTLAFIFKKLRLFFIHALFFSSSYDVFLFFDFWLSFLFELRYLDPHPFPILTFRQISPFIDIKSIPNCKMSLTKWINSWICFRSSDHHYHRRYSMVHRGGEFESMRRNRDTNRRGIFHEYPEFSVFIQRASMLDYCRGHFRFDKRWLQEYIALIRECQ